MSDYEEYDSFATVNESTPECGFAEDLIERYLRGQISFDEFCNSGNTQPSTSSLDDGTVVELATITIDNNEQELNLAPEHNYVGRKKKPFTNVKMKPHSFPQVDIAVTRHDYHEQKHAVGRQQKNIVDEELLSKETSALLAEIKEAYAKKAVSLPAPMVESDDDDEDEEDESVGFFDDTKDEDYVPSVSKKKKPKMPRFTKARREITDQSKSSRTSTPKSKKEKIGGEFGPMAAKLREKRDGSPIPMSRKKLPEELHSLLGQANVYFVQGRVNEAMQMCHEVVRQKPHHSEPYDVLAAFYEQLGDMEKHLQFALLAAHLDYRCPADKWISLATLALEQGKREQAINCYSQAAKAEPTNLQYYETKIKLLEETFPKSSRKILETKQAAVRGTASCQILSLEDYLAFALPVFEESYASNDIAGSLLCLKSCLQRGRLENVPLYKELNHYLELLIHRRSFDDAVNAVFTFTELKACSGKDVLVNVSDRKRRPITKFIVPDDFPVDIEAKTIVSLIYLKNYESAKPLLSHLEKNFKSEANVDLFLDIADSLSDNFHYEQAESLLVSIVNCPDLPTAGVWLCYADVLSALGRLEAACKAYHNVVKLAPQHVNARLSLAALQQQLGLSEEALLTLDITDNETLLDLDERLLYQKSVLLEQQNDMNGYYKCARQFLAMFFKEAYNAVAFSSLANRERSKLSRYIRPVLLETLRNTQLERLVKKVPASDPKTVISNNEVWNIFFKVLEKYFNDKRFQEMLHMCCYAYMCPALISCDVGYVDQIVQLLLLASFKTKSTKVMYTVLRYAKLPEDRNSYWNMMGLLFMFSSEVTYQRFVLRRMMNQPDNIALAWFNGNNSLYSGTYHHALAEYVSILPKIPEDPLLNLLIAITFINLSTKKDINRRHDICIQGLCFLDKYQKLRGQCQETFYNMGRSMHQLGLTYAAIYYYEKALNADPPPIVGNEAKNSSEMFDLKRLAAHNLSLIYSNSGNKVVARLMLEKYCTI